MKKSINALSVLLLATLILLTTASCGKKPEQQTVQEQTGDLIIHPETDGENSEQQTGQAQPHGLTFHPETDYDNRYSSLVECDMLETEDAYYLHNCINNGFLYYYDKASGETGVLCPRPECLHDEIRENKECVGFIGYEWASLQYYQGKLWYFNVTKGMKFGLFRMNPDGSEKELVHEFDAAGTNLAYGNRRLYIHRGVIYHAGVNQEIEGAAAFHKLVYGCIPMSDMTLGGQKVKAWEYHQILERDTINQPQPMMLFLGDYAYMFYCYDGLTEYDGDMPDNEAWWNKIPVTDEIARWDPTMTEPEILYQNVERYPMLRNYSCGFVTSDGTPYFKSSRFDPDLPAGDDNPTIVRLFRVEKDGTRTTVFESSKDDGNTHLLALGDGVFVTADSGLENMKNRNVPVNIRIYRYGNDGVEILWEGELPLNFRKELPIGNKTMSFSGSWVTENTMMLMIEEYYGKKDLNSSWQFVKYDITPDGLIETVVSEGFSTQFWATD